MRFTAQEAGTYVIYATEDHSTEFPGTFAEVGRMTADVGPNMWTDPNGLVLYRRYVVVQER